MKARKMINFDLSTIELKKYYKDTREPYGLIKKFMLENGFEHRQYSGYASTKPMSNSEVTEIARKMSKEFPWLGDCIQEFDVTDIGKQYSLKDNFKNQNKAIPFLIDEKYEFIEKVQTLNKDEMDSKQKGLSQKQNEFLAQFYMNYKNDYNHDNPAYEPSFNDALAWELEKAKEMGDDYVSKEAKEIALRMSNGEDLDLGAEMGLEPTLSSKIDNSAVLAAYQPLLAKEEAIEDKKIEIKETNQENLEANQTQQDAYDQEARNQEQIKQQEKVAEQIKKDQEEFEQKKQDLKDKIWNSVKTVASVATFIPPLTAVGLPIKGAMLLGKGYAMLKGIRMTHDALELASFAKEAVEYDKEATAYVNSQTGKVEQVIDNTQGINLENKENLTAQFNPSFS